MADPSSPPSPPSPLPDANSPRNANPPVQDDAHPPLQDAANPPLQDADDSDNLSNLVAARRRLRAELALATRDERNEKRKRKRLLQRGGNLSDQDLIWLMKRKGGGPGGAGPGGGGMGGGGEAGVAA